MSAFINSQIQTFNTADKSAWPELQHSRELSIAEAERIGFPHNQLERWKHAPLRALSNKPYAPIVSATNSVDETQLPAAPRIVFVNGFFSQRLSNLDAMPELRLERTANLFANQDSDAINARKKDFSAEDSAFFALNQALAHDGIQLIVNENSHSVNTLHLVFVHSDDSLGAYYLQHKILCEANSSLQLVEHHIGSSASATISNHLWQLQLKPNSKLCHIRTQALDHQAIQLLQVNATLEDNANYQRLDIETGCHFLRHEMNFYLQSNTAHVESGGVLWATGHCTLDSRLNVYHQAPNTHCALLWRGMADDKARVNFYGGIHIDKGADGSNATLSNKNLLLSSKAQVNTQPALEIYADEVKAAHGATVGQLDQQAMFYLQSRGINETNARAMLSQAFYAEALTAIEDAKFVSDMQKYLPAQFQQQDEIA